MNAGRMNKLININKSTYTARSTDGAPIITLSTKASNVWAEAKPITGTERFIQNAKYYEADIQFTMRYTTVLTEKCQIKYNSEYYDINKYSDPYGRNKVLIVLGKLKR